VQSLVAELIIGPQPEARAAFARATLTGTAHKFSGWQMSGWIRWLEGLRGSYERRMATMCQILDSGTHEIKTGSFIHPSSPVTDDWGVVTKTKLISYVWPRGGMFVWLRINFESHPLWGAKSSTNSLVSGPMLSTALLMFLTTKPLLVLVAPGSMFSATPEIRAGSAWAYYRLCFAAETDENVEVSSEKFVEGVHRFWRIKRVEEIEKLVEKFPHVSDVESLAESMGQMGTWLGC
jgi:DNA-binding transcriptional MocR family regulator